jgi:GT2 family glycosyltransferase
MQDSEFEISIIIPTYNRGNILKKCLDALAGQTVHSDYFEVIVSDDGEPCYTGSKKRSPADNQR